MNEVSGKNYEFIVPEEYNEIRLDLFLSKINDDHSRSFFQKLIKTGKVLLNDLPAKPSAKVTEGDEVFLNIPPAEKWHLEPEKIPLNIIYEDSSVLVVNKPAGMVVHPGAGIWSGTLVNGLLEHCGSLSAIGGIIRPGIVHRLDKNTSGLLVTAKNDKAHIFLQKQFQDRSISRKYLALVWGRFSETEGQIEGNISRSHSDRKKMAVSNDGKEAVTYYKVLQEFPFCSLLEVKLATGRTHQI
ncbi:MAG: RluA family pseudouridine synthase, partial [Calditrichia bacterium]|nr:RluA family pseudouridine synthase [Calditrichia bacterium]